MATVSERSLIKMGAGGLVVVIPKAWVRYYGLRPGDRVVVLTNGEVRIKPKRNVEQGGVRPGRVRQGDEKAQG